MVKKIKKAVLADERLENNLQLLGTSRHPEDSRTYRVLRTIQRRLLKDHQSAAEIPKAQVPRVYQRMFNVSNLWSLDLPPHGTVLFTRVGDELRIVDIL